MEYLSHHHHHHHCDQSTYIVHESKFFVRQLLLLGHDVLGQLQQGILVTPEQLPHGNFHEGFDLQDVHDAGHGQPEESGGVLRLRRGALDRKKHQKNEDL